MASSPQRSGLAVTASELSVDQILERYTNALGGREAIEKIKSRSIKGSTEYTGSIERASASLEVYWKSPDKSLAIQKASFGDIKRGFNGSQAWALHPHNGSQVRILGEDQVMVIKREIALSHPYAIKALYSRLTVGDRKGIDGRNALMVIGESADGKSDRFYFDTASQLLFRLEQGLGGSEGAKTPESICWFDDYKQVDGVQIPFTTRLQRPSSYMLIKYSEVKHNTVVEDSLFDPPGSSQK